MASEDVPHPSMGGLGRHAITLARALADAGHEVDFMGNNVHPQQFHQGDPSPPRRFLRHLDLRHIYWKEQQLGFFNYYRRAFVARRFAKAILRVANEYDVIHYHGHYPLVANYIPKNINFVQTRHDQGSDCLAHMRFRNGDVCRETDPRACAACATTRPKAVQAALSAASVSRWRKEVKQAFQRHKVIFVSQFLRDNLARTLGPLNGTGVYVVHNFLDLRALREALTDDNDARATAPDIFIAARVDAAKGVGTFLAAAEDRLPRGRRIMVAGDGPERAVLRERFSGDWIEFLGWIEYRDVLKLTARARAVVVPSVCEEAFGQTTLEALMLGRPVLALRRGGTPELQRYAQYPGQLHLTEDMESLVIAALDATPSPAAQDPIGSLATHAEARILEIEAIYKAN